MEIKIIILLNLICYSFIVSQSLIYIIALSDVQRSMNAPAYIAFRKSLDRNFRKKFKYPFYLTLLSNSALVLVCGNQPGTLRFLTAVVALAAFMIDTFFMLKGNMPINNLINTWSDDDYPANWAAFRQQWLAHFRKRQVANITGYTCLLVGAVFG
ncbi:MAG: hypothetical protein GC171_04650 [Terrimonas sp.]|nr:hypothetical protein [Terrimonas sp.]